MRGVNEWKGIQFSKEIRICFWSSSNLKAGIWVSEKQGKHNINGVQKCGDG